MADFEINGVKYQSRKLDGEKQTLLMKRLLPVFTALAAAASRAGDLMAEAPGDDNLSMIARAANALMPVSVEVSKLPDEDVDFIINTCLDATKRRVSTGVGWVDVRQNGVIQDRDDDAFLTRLTITWHVLLENFTSIARLMGLDPQKIAEGTRG